MKPKLLFLAPHMPSPSAREAGHVSAFRDLETLAEKYEIHLVSFRTKVSAAWPDKPLTDRSASAKLFTIGKTDRIKSVLASPNLPAIAAVRYHAECASYIRQLKARHRFSRVHLEGQQMAVYQDIWSDIPDRTLYVHDVLSQMFRRKGEHGRWITRRIYSFEQRRVERWEASVFELMTRIFAPSGKDASLIQALAPRRPHPVQIVPLHFHSYAPRRDVPTGPPVLVYWGAYSRTENVGAVRFLVEDILPALKRVGLHARIRIVGANPPDWFRNFPHDVEVTGFLQDPGDALRSATIAVIPLRLGAGVKIKVLELLSAGVPVITTTIGAEGISAGPEDGLIVVDPISESFAVAICDLCGDPRRLTALSNAAAAWAKNHANASAADLL